MLTIAISTVSFAGVVLLCRKAAVVLRSMLELSDELSPLRPATNATSLSRTAAEAQRPHLLGTTRTPSFR